MAVLGYGLIALAVVLLLLVLLFLVAPNRMKDFFGTTALWARSLATSRAESQGKRKHHRRTDPPKVEHEHARRPTPARPSLLMTIRGFASPPRDSGARRRHDDTEDPET